MKAFIITLALYCTMTRVIRCGPFQSSCDHLGSLKISYQDAESEEDIWRIGCNIKCRLTEAGIFKDGIVHSTIVDPDFKEHDIINECTDKFHEVGGNANCSHFFELWKCMEQLREPWSHLENIKDIEGRCAESKECFGKCIYEHLGIFQNGVFRSEYTPDVLRLEYRKFIVESLNFCYEDAEKRYEEDEKYSCLYFEDLDVCFKKQFYIF